MVYHPHHKLSVGLYVKSPRLAAGAFVYARSGLAEWGQASAGAKAGICARRRSRLAVV